MIGPALVIASIALAGGDASSSSPPSASTNPWSNGPPAPQPTTSAPYPQPPREPGANVEQLDVPPSPPDPKGRLLDDGVPRAFFEPRFSTSLSRSDLVRHGALDLDSALVDVPGLWLRHEQAGNARLLSRGLDERDVDVTLDDVPVFDLGGLVPALEQFPNAAVGALAFHNGPHALSSSLKGAAGTFAISSLDELRDRGESFGLRGDLGAGYGGPNLDKGVFADVDTGYGRAQLSLDAAFLDREDQRLGRGSLAVEGQEPGGLLFASGGDGGALGARVDVVPVRRLHVFTTWHSSRVVDTPYPATCHADDNGNAADCSITRERGVDIWIAGADGALDVAGADVIVRARAHMQHGVATDERLGTAITVDDHAFDDGVRAGALTSVELRLPSVAFVDVWTPRASIGFDVYGDRFSSTFFERSTRSRDAEPPGNGLPDASRARLASVSASDGTGTAGYGSLDALVAADGQRATLWAAGKVADATSTGAFAQGELGARANVVDALSAYVAAIHSLHDDTIEGGLTFDIAWLALEGDVYGASRDALPTIAGQYVAADTVAYGVEARGALHPGFAGLSASATFNAVVVEDGALLNAHTPHAGVPNPAGTVELAWDPPALSSTPPWSNVRVGFFSRARYLLPQNHLAPRELDEPALCPELPSPDQIAAGAVQQAPCSGASGAFAFDLGAHVDAGAFRVDVVGENLLDQQGALRDEPIGFGGTAIRALLSLAL